MDLVAYVTPMNQIAVHRINWQKLCVLDIPVRRNHAAPSQNDGTSSANLICDLCWHPCGAVCLSFAKNVLEVTLHVWCVSFSGRVLVAGLSNGQLELFSLDKSEVLSSFLSVKLDAAVAAVSWTQQIIVEPDVCSLRASGNACLL